MCFNHDLDVDGCIIAVTASLSSIQCKRATRSKCATIQRPPPFLPLTRPPSSVRVFILASSTGYTKPWMKYRGSSSIVRGRASTRCRAHATMHANPTQSTPFLSAMRYVFGLSCSVDINRNYCLKRCILISCPQSKLFQRQQ